MSETKTKATKQLEVERDKWMQAWAKKRVIPVWDLDPEHVAEYAFESGYNAAMKAKENDNVQDRTSDNLRRVFG